jgi:thymidylate synthase (FAD)
MIKVLNEGHVQLIDHMGSDLAISRNARVSYAAEWRAGEADTKLINYLYNAGHNTPFEAVTFTFDVKAPIFVLRQWHRHRTQSYNELSARYKELPEEFFIPELDTITFQHPDNKQMRTDEQNPNAQQIQDLIVGSNKSSFIIYHELIKLGCPRELARSILPVGTYSHMFCTLNLNNLFKFLHERCHYHAQYEIQVYANAMLELVKPIVPVAMKCFEDNFDFKR